MVSSGRERDKAILSMAEAIERRRGEILEENSNDVALARKKSVPAWRIDQLLLDEHRVSEIAQALRVLASLPDPVGQVERGWQTSQGLKVELRRVPFGVVAVLYESHPDVTVNAAALCIKAGNSVVLRGGSLAYATNRILAEVVTGAVLEAGLPEGCIQFVASRDREYVEQLIRMHDLIDVVIARGGPGLRGFVLEYSQVPVILASSGNCHLYVDSSADLEQAVGVVATGKLQRSMLCSAFETVLIHQDIAPDLVPRIAAELQERGVTIYGCGQVQDLVGGQLRVRPATDYHYAREFLGPELALRVVTGLEDALAHIRRYGTGLAEAILTRDLKTAEHFAREVDTAMVYVNASPGFAGASDLGLGPSLCISTQKLHVRGPVTPRELTTCRYVVVGGTVPH